MAVFFEKTLKQFSCLRTDLPYIVARNNNRLCSYGFHYCKLGLGVEGCSVEEHAEQSHAQSPHINRFCPKSRAVWVTFLWGHEVISAFCCFYLVTVSGVRKNVAYSEIDYLGCVVLVDKNVLRLDVTMHNASVMQMLQTQGRIPNAMSDCFFFDKPVLLGCPGSGAEDSGFDLPFNETSPLGELHDEHQFVICVNNLKQFDYVWMGLCLLDSFDLVVHHLV